MTEIQRDRVDDVIDRLERIAEKLDKRCDKIVDHLDDHSRRITTIEVKLDENDRITTKTVSKLSGKANYVIAFCALAGLIISIITLVTKG